MNLLLLLSVLLSALGGAGVVARPVAPAALAAPIAVAATLSAQPIAVKKRPTARIADRVTVARAPLTTVFALAAAEPRYAARRRE